MSSKGFKGQFQFTERLGFSKFYLTHKAPRRAGRGHRFDPEVIGQHSCQFHYALALLLRGIHQNIPMQNPIGQFQDMIACQKFRVALEFDRRFVLVFAVEIPLLENIFLHCAHLSKIKNNPNRQDDEKQKAHMIKPFWKDNHR